MTGEITRSFFRHKVFRTLFAVEHDDSGLVLAAAVVSEASACPHALAELSLALDDAVDLNKHAADYELATLQCSDPKHLLADIATAERECQLAEAEWNAAHREAKSLKETFEKKASLLRSIVREATSPRPMPLFDQATGS